MVRKKPVLLKIFMPVWWLVKYAFIALWWLVKNISLQLSYSVKWFASRSNEARKGVQQHVAKKLAVPAQISDVLVKDVVGGNFEIFLSRLMNDSLIISICGRRGSGKSTLGFRLMENINAKTRRPCFVLGVQQDVLPAWIDSVEDLNEIRNGGVVLVDEGAVSFSSRNAMSKKNKALGELLAIARHKDLTLLLVTQNTGMLDKNVLNLCDTILLKEGSLLQSEMERPVMKKLYEKVADHFKKLAPNERKSHAYVFDADFEGLISVQLPSFWNERISKNQAQKSYTTRA
ncbi:MAG: hypothetical protein HY363_05775 [Candidatus Aenigmarchaeota archaeon]|nr:hypothetical protein [Candidatus Aenigmarchaeota archaeon]